MKIGNYNIYPIETGRFWLDGGAMFGIIPYPLWSKTNPPDERNRIELASRALLVVGDNRVILIDNGNGSKFTEKQKDIYHLDTSRCDLLSSLRSVGYSASDVTDVVLTHLHFDHAGGSTSKENGELVPTFPRARYYVQEAHWQQALHPTEKDRGSFMQGDFLPLGEHRVIEFLNGECNLFPGISVLVVNGHTTAQQLPVISDGTTTILFCCDLFPTTAHVPLPYIMAYDLRPLTTLEEKKRILHSAVENDWILYFEHDPLTPAGKVTRTDKGFAFHGPVVL
jgi:glyoxylase-like metal-dependent hydrolase (beta-lactamase superfamily II)